MKKLILLALGVAFLNATNAQAKFGVKAGFNFANVTDANGAKTRTGVHLGVLANVPLIAGLSLQPEVVYSGQGAKYDVGSLNNGYINIPVLARYTFPVGFFIETGPQAGFLISAKAKQGGTTVDVKDQYKKTDISWAYGIGYKLPLGLGLNVRYNMGVSKLADNSNSKNSVIQVGAFFMLP